MCALGEHMRLVDSTGRTLLPGGSVGIADELKFYMFHHHHYSVMPDDMDDVEATWVSYPNSRFDPHAAHQLYRRHLRTLQLAETLGFDGITINEHHNTIYSMTPVVSVMAGAVVAATDHIKIQVAGVPVNLEQPHRVAEAYAMLDNMSGGRMEYAFPLGTGMEYWSNSNAINPATSRERFRESLEIILKCWTEDGPQSFDGDFYRYKYLNPWPKTYQQPRPKCFVVGSGSSSTIELATDLGLGYSLVFTPIPHQLKAFEAFREASARKGNPSTGDDYFFIGNVYVADTDEQADREVRPYIERFWSWFHRVPPKFLLPPGYVSTEEFLRRAADAALAHGTEASYDDMAAIGRLAVGSPDTVADILYRWAVDAGTTRMNVVFEHADMPEWMTIKNMTMFAEEVVPRIRAKGIDAAVAATPAAAVRG